MTKTSSFVKVVKNISFLAIDLWPMNILTYHVRRVKHTARGPEPARRTH